MFRHMDIDYSKKIVFEELKIALKTYGIEISRPDLEGLFRVLDKDNSGEIDFCEFMIELRPDMCPTRVSVVTEAFQKLDVNKDGVLNMDDLQGKA